jgi:hypothetical protein
MLARSPYATLQAAWEIRAGYDARCERFELVERNSLTLTIDGMSPKVAELVQRMVRVRTTLNLSIRTRFIRQILSRTGTASSSK